MGHWEIGVQKITQTAINIFSSPFRGGHHFTTEAQNFRAIFVFTLKNKYFNSGKKKIASFSAIYFPK